MKKYLLAFIILIINYIPSSFSQITEVVGDTKWDKQADGSLGRKIVVNPDGTISLVWTFRPDAQPIDSSMLAYQYYDGTSWSAPGPITGFFSKNRYPVIGVTHSNKEIILSRSQIDNCIEMLWRMPKGTGTWTSNLLGLGPNNDVSPKIAVKGDTIYSIWQSEGNAGASLYGQHGPIFFSRSFDNGVTWNLLRTIITEIDSDYYHGFPNGAYAIDAHDNTVAIAYAGKGNDVGLLKSVDAGQTWTKTIIDPFPIPMFDAATMISDTNGDFSADTILSNGEDPEILIDNNGKCHVWYSSLKIVCASPGINGIKIDAYTDGLMYWNENIGTSPWQIAEAKDYNGDGRINFPSDTFTSCTPIYPFGDYKGGLTSRPSASIDVNGNIIVAYQSINELTDTFSYHMVHRHVFAIFTLDNGNTWTYPYNVIPSISVGGNGENQECIYPALPRNIYSSLQTNWWVYYQRDGVPGISRGSVPGTCDCDKNTNLINELVIAHGSFQINIEENQNQLASLPFPQPSNSFVNFNLKKEINRLIIYDSMCRLINIIDVISTDKFQFNVSDFTPGIYFFRFASGNSIEVKKVVVCRDRK